MIYYSTNQHAPTVSMKAATLQGLAPDRGLYLPENIPALPEETIEQLTNAPFHEIAFEIAKCFVNDELTESRLHDLVKSCYNFDVPIRKLWPDTYVLELFEGPTLAFKDFGARFMARLTGAFAEEEHKLITILVATSGDTGSAVAYGFQGVPNTRVVILYPSGKVSPLQEQQLTTAGENVRVLEVKGDFDACQSLVKEAFANEELRAKLTLTSANSINIARLIPQSFYYAYAALRLKAENPQKNIVFSVPSGNFGNLTAGVMAKKMGFPISHFIAASNKNDSVTRYLASGVFEPHPTIETLSTAMDVGHPSNFARLYTIYGESVEAMRREIKGYSVTDEETGQEMKSVYQKTGYVLDPHTAVGMRALEKYRAEGNRTDELGVVLSTAHPAKFLETVKQALDIDVDVPERLAAVMNRKKQATVIEDDFEELRKFLLSMSCDY